MRKLNSINKLRIAALGVVGAIGLAASPALALSSVDVDFLNSTELGYVGHNDTLTYEHTFDPYFDNNIQISAIDSTWLYVAVVDDWQCARFGECVGDWLYQAEVAAIDLNSVEWADGRATASIFYGDVTSQADLMNNNGVLEVTVESRYGDFVVLWSRLATRYSYDLIGPGGGGGGGSGTNPMPEPSAALMFAIGALVIRRTMKQD